MSRLRRYRPQRTRTRNCPSLGVRATDTAALESILMEKDNSRPAGDGFPFAAAEVVRDSSMATSPASLQTLVMASSG